MGQMVAIIPVKGNSERVPSKNLRNFGDTTLLEHKLKQVTKVNSVSKVVVSSEDDRALSLAEKYGALAHKRDPYFSTSSVPMSEVYSYIAKEVAESGDDIIWTQVTSPFADSNIYEEACQLYRKMDKTQHDSILSVTEIKGYIIHNNTPLNFKPNPWPRSQDLKGTFEINFAINVLPRDTLMKGGSLYTEKPYFYPISRETAMDIDTPMDFEICEYFYKKKNS